MSATDAIGLVVPTETADLKVDDVFVWIDGGSIPAKATLLVVKQRASGIVYCEVIGMDDRDELIYADALGEAYMLNDEQAKKLRDQHRFVKLGLE